MSCKQKTNTMKSFALHLLLILCFTSCITSTHVHYSDPNYLNSNEFSTYEEMTKNHQIEQESFTTETTADSNSHYSTDDYYDYSFSSRIRRFHRPIYYSGYYGGIYTDYYWYNNDPFFCGTSIYYGYNWYSPYYSYYSYSPFYFDYYTPYYYGNYHLYHGYGYGYNHYHHASHNTYANGNNYNAYITGHRGRLSSNNGGRKINLNTTSTTNTKRGQTTIKNNTDRNHSTINTNSNRGKNSYSNTKRNTRSYKSNDRSNSRSYKSNDRSNNRSYNSNNRSNKSNSSSQSSRRGGKSNMKPRR